MHVHIHPILALKPTPPPRHVLDIIERLSRQTPEHAVIRCPACAWRPLASSRWSCIEAGAPEHFGPGCGEVWHSFATRGRCPGCSHQWRFTACLSCQAWSPHEDWYEVEETGM